MKWIETWRIKKPKGRRVSHRTVDDLKIAIEQVGMTEPILLKPVGCGRYECFDGWHRVLACKALGHKKVIAYILPNEKEEARALALWVLETRAPRTVLLAAARLCSVSGIRLPELDRAVSGNRH